MKYVIGYRCSLCDKLVIVDESSYECSPQEGKSFLSKMLILGDTYSGTQFQGMYPLKVVHNCDDGSIGVANFSGLISYTPEDMLN